MNTRAFSQRRVNDRVMKVVSRIMANQRLTIFFFFFSSLKGRPNKSFVTILSGYDYCSTYPHKNGLDDRNRKHSLKGQLSHSLMQLYEDINENLRPLILIRHM
jgi:hypothetical protein